MSLDRFGFVLRAAFLDCLRGSVDDRFGLFQAKAGDRAHLFDHTDLLVAGCFQHDIKVSLLFSGSISTTTASGGCGSNGSSSANAPLLLKVLNQLRSLQKGQPLSLVCNFLKAGVKLGDFGLFGHFLGLLGVFVPFWNGGFS